MAFGGRENAAQLSSPRTPRIRLRGARPLVRAQPSPRPMPGRDIRCDAARSATSPSSPGAAADARLGSISRSTACSTVGDGKVSGSVPYPTAQAAPPAGSRVLTVRLETFELTGLRKRDARPGHDAALSVRPARSVRPPAPTSRVDPRRAPRARPRHEAFEAGARRATGNRTDACRAGADRDVTVAVIGHQPASGPGRGRRGHIGQQGTASPGTKAAGRRKRGLHPTEAALGPS
jgi:hypothetical protein